MDDKKLIALGSHDWEATIIKLSAYVVTLCRYNRKKLPGRIEPEDLAMESIEKVYNGDRIWNPDSDPDILRFLKSVVKSILSNAWSSAEQRTNIVELKESFVLIAPNNIENDIFCEELDRSIRIAMRGDPELSIVFKALKDGSKPSEIAEEYSIDINTIRNAQKRLHRMVLGLIE